MHTRYDNLLDLLMDEGTFLDQMRDLNGATVADILAAGAVRPRQARTFSEHYFTLVGKREGDVITCTTIDGDTQGNPGLVEFDWTKCRDRHVEHGDVIGWFHTHPPGAHGMSGQDAATFQSWLVAIGGPRYAVILCEGTVHAWELWLEGVDIHHRRLHAVISKGGTVTIDLTEI